DDAFHGLVLPGSVRRHVWTGGLSVLNVSRLMFNSENDFIKASSDRFGKLRTRSGPFPRAVRRRLTPRLFSEFDRVVRDEDEHVPDLVRSRTYFARLCVVPRIFTICKVLRRSPRRSRFPVTMTPSARASSTPHWE